jgi:hypothetical protein
MAIALIQLLLITIVGMVILLNFDVFGVKYLIVQGVGHRQPL